MDKVTKSVNKDEGIIMLKYNNPAVQYNMVQKAE